MIPRVTVSADRNRSSNANPGNSTTDQVFLLSITEANKYFSTDDERKCVQTAYAITHDHWRESETSWWLRTPGVTLFKAACVNTEGAVNSSGSDTNYFTYAVRPALWIDLS